MDIAAVPDEWLEAYAFNISRDDNGMDPDVRFLKAIDAIFLMHAIDRRDGVCYSADPDAVEAELVRRGLREPAPEVMTFREACRAIADGLEMPVWMVQAYIMPAVPMVMVRGYRRRLAEDVRKAIEHGSSRA